MHIIYPFLDEKWGERVVAVVQPRVGRTVDIAALSTFVKQQIGGVKTPKQIEAGITFRAAKSASC